MSDNTLFSVTVSTGDDVEKPPRREGKYPLLTMEMIECGGAPITSSQAIKLFKIYMIATGYLDKDEIAEHASYFANDMKRHAKELDFWVSDEKRKIRDAATEIKNELRGLKKERKAAKDQKEIELIDAVIDSTQEELNEEPVYLNRAVQERMAHKTDKRQFVIYYINRMVQGE